MTSVVDFGCQFGCQSQFAANFSSPFHTRNCTLCRAKQKAGAGNRTPDLLITSEPLCHLSYAGL